MGSFFENPQNSSVNSWELRTPIQNCARDEKRLCGLELAEETKGVEKAGVGSLNPCVTVSCVCMSLHDKKCVRV